jgi:hypothetical protein
MSIKLIKDIIEVVPLVEKEVKSIEKNLNDFFGASKVSEKNL